MSQYGVANDSVFFEVIGWTSYDPPHSQKESAKQEKHVCSTLY